MKWMIGAMVAIAAMVSAEGTGDDPPSDMVDIHATKQAGDTEQDRSGASGNRITEAIESPDEIAARKATQDYTSGVIGGPHDFSHRTGGQSNVCAACHIPHVQRVRVSPPQEDADSSRGESQDDDVFLELYRVEGQRATFEPDRYTPGPTSLICLGCHDGTMASSTIGSAHAMLAGVREGFNVPDGFVWRDHPIGVPYPRGDREYRPFGQVVAGGAVRMPQDRVECISCHDPHNAAGVDKMLVMSNRRSALCLSCHIK